MSIKDLSTGKKVCICAVLASPAIYFLSHSATFQRASTTFKVIASVIGMICFVAMVTAASATLSMLMMPFEVIYDSIKSKITKQELPDPKKKWTHGIKGINYPSIIIVLLAAYYFIFFTTYNLR